MLDVTDVILWTARRKKITQGEATPPTLVDPSFFGVENDMSIQDLCTSALEITIYPQTVHCKTVKTMSTL